MVQLLLLRVLGREDREKSKERETSANASHRQRVRRMMIIIWKGYNKCSWRFKKRFFVAYDDAKKKGMIPGQRPMRVDYDVTVCCQDIISFIT